MSDYANLNEIVHAAKAGMRICWKTDRYTVGVDMFGEAYVACDEGGRNPDFVKLFHTDGISSDYNAEDFYIAGKVWTVTVFDGYTTNTVQRKGTYEQVVNSCASYPPGYHWSIK